MKKYIGTKTIQAEPMTKGQAFDAGLLRAGNIPASERDIPGYRVVYGNGYESWSPEDVFVMAYRLAETPLDRLNLEYINLTLKADKITQFKKTDTYKNLRETDRAMLDTQFDAMLDYLAVLGARSTSMETGEGGFCGFGFGTAIHFLEHGYLVRRSGWNGKGLVVFKQVPAHIGEQVIPKMQSLSESAKAFLMSGKQFIDYTSQCLIYNNITGRADSWVPSIADVFARDWELVIPESK